MLSQVQNISQLKVDWIRVSGALLTMSYVTGILCIGFGLYPPLIEVTSFNLLLTFLLLLICHPGDKRKVLFFASLAYIIGFTAEVIGVQYGVLFGEYSYGKILGPKILGTPFMIGVNWSILVLSFGSVINQQLRNQNLYLKSVIGATALTAFDFLIEPVATALGMWTWIDNAVPAQNYLGWFIVSFTMFYFFFKLKIARSNPLAALTILLMFVFFLTLNLQLKPDIDIFQMKFSFLQ